MSLSLSVIIPTHDRPDSLRRTVESLLAQTTRPCEIVIINDGPSDVPGDLLEMIKDAGITVQYYRPETASSAGSRNRGLERASGDIVTMVDDDMYVPSDSLQRLVEYFQGDKEEQIAGIGGVIEEPPARYPIVRRVWWSLARLLGQGAWMNRRCAARYVRLPRMLRKQLTPARQLSSGCLLSLRRSTAEDVRFSERGTGYILGEDREFCNRVGARLPLFVANDLAVVHETHPTGRPDQIRLGRMRVHSLLFMAGQCDQTDLGSLTLIAYELVGMAFLHGVWGIFTKQSKNVFYAVGIVSEVWNKLGEKFREILVGAGKKG